MEGDTFDKGYPAFALYYRSDNNGKWYEEGEYLQTSGPLGIAW